MEHFWTNIHGWDDGIPPVYQSIVAQAEDGMHFVEVGAWKGRSSAFMAVEIINSGIMNYYQITIMILHGVMKKTDICLKKKSKALVGCIK